MINENYQKDIEAKELTDRDLYINFVNTHHNKRKTQYYLKPTETRCPYDVMQVKTDVANPYTSTSSLIELKAREEYAYEQFDEIYIDAYKIRKLLQQQEEQSADSTFIVVLYPLSDKIVFIDLTKIDWELVNNNQHPTVRQGFIDAPFNTTKDRSNKITKEVIYLPLKPQGNKTQNITYVYNYNGLNQLYNQTLNKYKSIYKKD